MRIYYDTEFTSLDGNVDWDMISAGFVTETGEELYIEITDFQREDCSHFVVETVLPLLSKGDTAPERMPATHFAWYFCNWLETFKEPIQLVSDSPVDWSLLHGYCHAEFAAFPVKVQGQAWVRSEKEPIKAALLEAELRFWHAHPGMQHHALYDARRLKLIADTQKGMQRALFGIEP